MEVKYVASNLVELYNYSLTELGGGGVGINSTVFVRFMILKDFLACVEFRVPTHLGKPDILETSFFSVMGKKTWKLIQM